MRSGGQRIAEQPDAHMIGLKLLLQRAKGGQCDAIPGQESLREMRSIEVENVRSEKSGIVHLVAGAQVLLRDGRYIGLLLLCEGLFFFGGQIGLALGRKAEACNFERAILIHEVDLVV